MSDEVQHVSNFIIITDSRSDKISQSLLKQLSKLVNADQQDNQK